MSMIKTLIPLGLLAVSLPGAALACACCADKGSRFEHQVELGEWELSELALLKTDTANLYLSACGLECVAGIDNPRWRYGANMSISESSVQIDLSDEAGQARGSISFEMPETYNYFAVDPNPGATLGNPELYTELRLRGTVSGSGDFGGHSGVEAELVFSGYGNQCVSAGTFDGWSLTVSGAATQYRLFGGMSQ